MERHSPWILGAETVPVKEETETASVEDGLSSTPTAPSVTEPGERPDWITYFLEMADLVATRATCNRAKHGAVIVMGRDVLTTGYNGSPPHAAHCLDNGCLMEAGHCIRTIHAEENAIIRAAKNGIKIEGADMYVTGTPCLRCRQRIQAAGIRFISYRNWYRDGVLIPMANPATEWA